MTYDEMVKKVERAIGFSGYQNYPLTMVHRVIAKAAIATIRETIETLDANQEQIGFEIAFDSFEILNGEPFLQTDVAQRMFSAMLAASPLGEEVG